MKAKIEIFSFRKDFSQDQKDILRRYLNVLREHNLSVNLVVKKKVKKRLDLNKVTLKVKKATG